jgi:hypothetical protein
VSPFVSRSYAAANLYIYGGAVFTRLSRRFAMIGRPGWERRFCHSRFEPLFVSMRLLRDVWHFFTDSVDLTLLAVLVLSSVELIAMYASM